MDPAACLGALASQRAPPQGLGGGSGSQKLHLERRGQERGYRRFLVGTKEPKNLTSHSQQELPRSKVLFPASSEDSNNLTEELGSPERTLLPPTPHPRGAHEVLPPRAGRALRLRSHRTASPPGPGRRDSASHPRAWMFPTTRPAPPDTRRSFCLCTLVGGGAQRRKKLMPEIHPLSRGAQPPDRGVSAAEVPWLPPPRTGSGGRGPAPAGATGPRSAGRRGGRGADIKNTSQ